MFYLINNYIMFWICNCYNNVVIRMNNVDLPDDSDSSDEDYVPAGSNEVLSEVDSDGDPEDPISDSEKVDVGKRRKKKSKPNKRKASDLEEGMNINI